VREDFDVVVVGGGVMGTATARSLVERGRHTLLLERFEIGHAHGSSGGPTRIFRLAYHHPDYVRMARLALSEWRELEARAGETLLVTTGSLDVGEGGREIAQALDAAGVSFEVLPPEPVVERWPALRFEPGTELLVQEEGGVCLSERTVRAQARLAAEGGATIVEHAKVDRIVATGIGAEVNTLDATYRAAVVVVTAGAWAAGLLAEAGRRVPLVPTLAQVSYFALDDPSPLPTVIDRSGHPSGFPYVVPNPEQPGRFKVGFHRIGQVVDPDRRSAEPDPSLVAEAAAYAARRLAPHRAEGGSETCLYTNTPDEDFVLDRRGSLVIGSPCSGHGFKFAPLVGRILADLVTADPSPIPIERFLAGRPALSVS
jgi:sarcosine oxidase